MARKTAQEKLVEINLKIKELRSSIRKNRLKFRRKLADDLFRSCEKALGVNFNDENVAEFQSVKERIVKALSVPVDSKTEVTSEIKPEAKEPVNTQTKVDTKPKKAPAKPKKTKVSESASVGTEKDAK